jgi:hypothetical protein
LARLYRVGPQGQLFEAAEKPFESETADLENFVKNNPKVLGDLLIFSEQTISAGRDKRTDFLAVNKDGEVVIVELKKDLAGSNVLGQVLGYRLYWKNNLEAVKNLWNESKKKPEGVQPDFANFDPKVLLVAPEFEQELTKIASSEGLPIEFVEISRYQHETSTFVLANPIEPQKIRVGAVTAQLDYDWDHYEKEIASKSSQVEVAKEIHAQLLGLAQKNSWDIVPKFNKYYIAFKHGNSLVFQLDFRHSGKVALVCNYLNDQSKPPNAPKFKWEWDKGWWTWFTEFTDPNLNLTDIETVLDEAYRRAL